MRRLALAIAATAIELVGLLHSHAQSLSGEWVQLFPPASPPARMNASLSYDAARDRLILFGGTPHFDRNVFFDDTWEWNGTTWSPATPQHRPPGRHAAYMAYDSHRQVVVLYGGQHGFGGGSSWGDMWEFDGLDWREVTPPQTPGPRGEGAMAYDRDRRVLVLYGGHIGGGPDLNDTWEYDGTTWREVSTASRPSLYNNEAMVYDRQQRQAVLVGGCGNGDRAWLYDGVNWTEGAMGPPSRNGLSLGYHPPSARTVAFGGSVGCGYEVHDDTWEWNGASWQQQTTEAEPTPRWGMPLDYVPGNAGLIGFGGGFTAAGLAETWLYRPNVLDADGDAVGDAIDNCTDVRNGDCGADAARCDVDGDGTTTTEEEAVGRQLDSDAAEEVNVGAQAAGGLASASSAHPGYPPPQSNDGVLPPYSAWLGAAISGADSLMIRLASPTTLDRLRWMTWLTMEFSDPQSQPRDYFVEYTVDPQPEWNSGTWLPVAQMQVMNTDGQVDQAIARVVGNTAGNWLYDTQHRWIDHRFSPVTMTAVRLRITAKVAGGTYGPAVSEIELYYSADRLGDACDNCPALPNADQADADADGLGDLCDPCPADPLPDADSDGVCGTIDNCPDVANANQTDQDADGTGDVCDDDMDGDGLPNTIDNCAAVSNPDQRDDDSDGRGNSCDECQLDPLNDTDSDDVCGDVDNCPSTANNDQADQDGDGFGDPCDNCPLRVNVDQRDEDADGVGNACDNCLTTRNADQLDADADTVGDVCDNCVLSYNPTQTDQDQDVVGDVCDNCLTARNESQHDFNGDSQGDECDLDDGLVIFRSISRPRVRWQSDPAYSTYNLYRGSLAVLLAGGPYTQGPGSNPYAGRFCGLTVTFQDDALVPVNGEAFYWLVAGRGVAGEEPLGQGAGVDRPNANPCP